MSNTRHFAEITNLRDKLRRGLAMLTVVSMLMPSGGFASEGTNQGKLKCILPEHTHSEACYETAVICGEEERQPEIVREFTGTFPVHVHKADCYDSEGKLICGMVEKEYYHTHSEFCRDTEGNLVCGLQSQPKHSHTEDCRDGEGNLICGLNPDWPVFTTSAENWKETVKDPGHQHTEACYETKLICGLEEHTHTDECYETVMPVSAVSEELQEENKDQTEPEGDESGENEKNDLEKIEEGLEETVEEVVDFISRHEEDQNGADQNPENAGQSSEELERTEVENENPVKDKAETDEEPTVPQENGLEEEREKEPREEEPKEEESGDGVTGEGEPEGVEPEDKVPGSKEPGSGEKTGKEEPAADGEEVNPLNPTPTDGAVIIETEQNPEGQPVEQVQTPEENAEQEIEKIENQGTENPEASPEQNPDKQEPADEEKQADEQEPADEKKQPEEQETADEEKQSDEKEVADEEKQADVVNPDGDPSDGESADEETEPVEEPVKFFEGTKVFEGPDYTVTATIGADACFPEDIELAVREILPGTDEYRMYSGQTADAATDEWSEIGEFARFFDITFLSGGAEVEPQAFIDVQITFREAIPVAEDADVQAIHFSEDGANVIESSTGSVEAAASDPDAVDTVNFTVDRFSVYGFFQRVVITTRVITAGGQTYRVEVTYGQDAGIPEGAVLSASEIKDGDEDYELYRAQAAAALEAGHVEMPGLYDICILDAEGQKVQPQGPVSVSITLENGLESEDIKVVHFPEGIEAARTEADGAAGETEEEEKRVTEETPEAVEKPVVAVEVISPEVSEQTVTFETDGFSVYALAYTVDFHFEGKDYSIEGNSQILLSELIQMLDIRNGEELLDVHDVENVTFTDEHLVTVQQVSGLITYNGAENKDVGDKEFLLSSLEPFTSDEKLTITLISGEQIIIGVTDEQVDNRITAEVYFLNTDGTRTSQAETESGNTLNARILLSNSNSNSGGKAYVKVSLDGLDDYVTLNESFKENAWDTITFRDMTTGVTFTMDVYYNTMDHSITYGVPAGATGIAALSFTAPNGITEDNKTLTLTPTLVDSNFNSITPEENDSISGPASGKWTSDFTWDPIQKYVNNNKENQVVVTSDNGTPKINTWLHYEYSANSQNRAETGVRWTDKAIIEDTLTLPAHMSFAGSYTCDTTDGRIYINGAPANDNILFGLTLKPNMTITNLEVRDGNKIYYRIEVTNPNRPDANSDLTAEMDNISYITELNAAAITLDPNYITASYYGEEIINAVSVTEKPCKGNDDETSQDQVKTKTKEDEGFTVNKESQQDGQYVQAGATIDYTIRVTNTGTVTIEAADSVVHDTLPSAVYLTEEEIARLQNVYGDKITIDGNNITFWTGELPAGGSPSELVIHATVRDSKALEQSGYTNESTITNTATYRGLSDYVASKLHAGSITAEKISDQNSGTPLENGQIVNFTLKAKNDTDYAYTGDVTFMDDLPPYLIVTLYDSTGTDITDATYAVEGTHNECYVRDSSNSLVPATVVINGDGSARITVNKTGGIAAHGNYAIVLSAKYDESKVNAKVNADGNVVFANTVNINNKQDHTDFTGKVGKVDLDKYVSEATLNGNQVTQPYSDGTIVTYNIHVVNDSQNPYTHDIVVTDTMPRGLVPIGLTVNGMTYDSWQTFVNAFGWQEKEATILDGSGNSQPVKVVQAYNGLKISWTIPNPVGGQNITSRDISYQALVKTDELVNQTTGLQDLENTATAVGREDKEIIVVDVKGVEISKKIVGPNGELLDTIEIGPGSVVTYELTIDNPEHLNTTVTGITDYLPQGGPQSTFPLSYWVLGETVLVDETTTGKNEFYINATPYPNQDANYGRKYWFDNNHWLRFGDISIKSEQEKLVQRITLKYPDDPAILHTMFVDTVWGRQQRNKYSITGMTPVEVDHTEVANKKYYAQKSVIGLAKDIGYNYAALNSKDLFNIGDISDVFYTVIVANTGTGTLHINSLTDILPSELKFVGIANSDYNAGTHSYNGAITISTADQNNNPNYVIPAGYSGLSGVSVTATEPTGNTVLFKLNGDDGVDLPEKHVLAFDVQCKIKDSVTLTNGQAITNTFLASLDGDAVLSRIPITTQKTPDNSIQNNGGCSVVSNDGTTQIAESTVSIHPSNVAVPGILKKAIAYQPMHDTEWHALNDNTTNINSQSAVKWKITLYNDGAVPINLGYTLSDTIYEHHSFSSIESFTINGSTKDVTAGPFTSYTTTKEGQYNRYEFTFPAGADYAIPAGGKAELVLVTSFTTGQYQGQLDNEAIFSPVQEWDANRVIRGQLEKNEAGTAYTGVSSMDYVNMLGDGATMSYKIAAEKGNPENTAYGYDIATGKNYVTVDDTSTVITYTNHVQNLSNATFKRFVMIDRMPEIGDTGVVNAHEQRGSEYSIGFANALNLRLTFRNSDGTKSITLTEEDYTLEFSDHTSFTTEDWEGTSTWDASAADAKAFRLKLNPGTLTAKINDLENSTLSEAVFPSMWVLEVSYDGKLSTDGTPGQYAWNSFGYHYTTAADVNMSAEPTKAGVRIKPLPVLKKQVVDNQGVDQGIDTNVLFTFKFYEGSHTPEETASLPTIWTTTLYQGQAVQLLAQKTVNGVTTGHFTEGQEYTVIEEAVAGYDLVGYEKDGLKQTTIGYCVFKYSNELNTTIVCQNQISGFAPEAEKVLLTTSSRALQNGEFTFELLELSNADLNDLSRTEVIGNRIQQAGNDTAGHVQFDNMEFSAEGTYYYLLREVPGSDTSICYDDTVYLVAVQVDAAGGRFTATGTYYKVTESDDTDPIKAVQPVPAAELPEFINTESTQIEVQKIWAGDATTGKSTMVLYRTIGEQAAVPTNKIAVTFNATPDHTPADSGFITVSYTGSDGSTGSTMLNNANDWTDTFILDRGVSYNFNYSADGSKVTSVITPATNGVETTQTINISATANPAVTYIYTFTVPSANRPAKGIVNVTMNETTKQLSALNNWTESFNAVEETNVVYSVASENGLISTVTVDDTYNNAVASGNRTINVTPVQADLMMEIPVSVTWSGTPDDGTTVTVVFTHDEDSEEVVLNASPWSITKILNRLDDDGELITWSVSATVTGNDAASISGAPATISDSGSVALTGSVAQGMTVIVRSPENKYINIAQLFRTDKNKSSDIEEFEIIQNTTSWQNSQTYTKENLAVKDENGEDCYYGIWYYSNISVTSSANDGGLGILWNRMIWFKAQPGTVIIEIKIADTDSYTKNVNLAIQTFNTITVRAYRTNNARFIASNGTPDSALGTATTFADASVGGSGTAFSAIHFKDLPDGAAVATDIVGADEVEQVIDNGGTYTWSNLPAVDNEGHRIYYYVVEKEARANADEVSVSYAYEYNTPNDPASGIRKVIVTNSTARTRGALTIDKLVTVDSQTTTTTYADGTYSFTITGPENYSHTETITVSGGQATGNITLSDLVPGYYTVTEAETSNGTSLTGRTGGTASGERGIVIYVASGTTAAQNVVTFTNNAETGTAVRNDSVTVNKLDENSEALPGATFTLYSTNNEGMLSGPIRTYGGEGISSFRISTADIELASYLPAADQGSTILYLQETEAPAGYRLSDKIHSVEITAAVSGPAYDSVSGKWLTTTTYTMTIDGEKTANIPNTPVGSLEVTKTVTGTFEAGQTFPFTVTAGGQYVTGERAEGTDIYEYTGLSETDPQYTVTKDQTITFTGLPAGTYVVTEGDADLPGFVRTTTYTVGNEDPTDGPASAEVTRETPAAVTINNHYRDAQLIIRKAITGVQEDDLDAALAGITFTVTDVTEGDEITRTPDISVTITSENLDSTDGTYFRTLTSADNGIIPDHKYRITETVTAPDGYILTGTAYTVKAGTPDADNDPNSTAGALTLTDDDDTSAGEIDFTNTYDLTKLTISKAMSGGSSGGTFSFTVDVRKGDGNAYTGTAYIADETEGYTTITFTEDGLYTASVAAGGSLTIYGLPVGYTYTVTEADADGFRLVSINGASATEENHEATGTISAEESTAAFINEELVDIEATKTWYQAGDNTNSINSTLTNAQVTFTLQKRIGEGEWANVDITGNPATKTVTSADPEAWKVSWTNLPKYEGDELISYRVLESGATVSNTAAIMPEPPAAIAEDFATVEGHVNQTAAVNIDNTLPKTSVVVDKQWYKDGKEIRWPADIASITVGLHQSVNGEEAVPVTTGENKNPVTITFGDGAAEAQRTFSDLPVFDVNGSQIIYSIEELGITPAGDGAAMVPVTGNLVAITEGDSWTVGNGAVSNGAAVVTNTMVKTGFDILKVNGNNETQTLCGAEFTLKKYGGENPDENGYSTVAGYELITVDDHGSASVTGLTDGTYRLYETKAPAGYTAYSGEIEFTITKGEISFRDTQYVTYAKTGDAPGTFTVRNYPGVELPATGGPGTNLLYLLGSMLVMLAGAGFILLQRKKRVE